MEDRGREPTPRVGEFVAPPIAAKGRLWSVYVSCVGGKELMDTTNVIRIYYKIPSRRRFKWKGLEWMRIMKGRREQIKKHKRECKFVGKVEK